MGNPYKWDLVEAQRGEIKLLRGTVAYLEKRLTQYKDDVMAREWNYYCCCLRCLKLFVSASGIPDHCDECPSEEDSEFHITYLGRFNMGKKG